jgi:hypothetical protein
MLSGEWNHLGVLSGTKSLLLFDIFKMALEEGIPIGEAANLLAAGTLLNFELSKDSVGDLLGIPRVNFGPSDTICSRCLCPKSQACV